jgi:hypothetical protein
MSMVISASSVMVLFDMTGGVVAPMLVLADALILTFVDKTETPPCFISNVGSPDELAVLSDARTPVSVKA